MSAHSDEIEAEALKRTAARFGVDASDPEIARRVKDTFGFACDRLDVAREHLAVSFLTAVGQILDHFRRNARRYGR